MKKLDGNAILARALQNPHIRIEGLEGSGAKNESAPTPAAEAPAPKLRRKRRRQMNGTEARYADLLAAMQRRGDIVSFEFEGMAVFWGGTENDVPMRYVPDFTVVEAVEQPSTETQGAAMRLKFIEVKGGHIYSRDVVRFKGARAAFPLIRFEMWQWKQKTWTQLA